MIGVTSVARWDAAMDELEFIDWLRERVGERARPAEAGDRRALPYGIGDDMAVVDVPGGRVLFSSDMLLDGRHFDTTKHAYDAIGRKAINCCLADCAAMAVKPVAVTVSLAFSQSMTDDQTKALMEGVLAAAGAFDVQLVGGDTTRWSSPLAIDVSVVAAPYPNIDPVTRGGAKVGDAFFVTGPLGGGLAPLPPWVRLLERVERWITAKVIIYHAGLCVREADA